MRRLLVILPLVAGVTRALAQEPVGVVRTDGGVAFDFQDADLRIVLTSLAKMAGINIVYGNLPGRQVTLRTGGPVPVSGIRALLESVLRANDLEMVEEGAVTRILAPSTTAEPRGPSGRGAPSGEIRLFVERLRYADASAMAQTLQSVFGIESSGGLAEEGSAGTSQPLSQALREQNIPPVDPRRPAPAPAMPAGVAGHGPQAGDSASVSAVLRGEVTIVPDPVTNALLIRATQLDYETIHAAMLRLDVRPLQVLIEVLIAEVRRNKSTAVGVSWRIPFQAGDTSAMATLAGASTGDFVLKVLGLGSVNADFVLQALATSGNVTILSRPVILAQNAEEARILVGDQRPFVQVSRALPTDNAARDEVVQYRNVGTQLSIRPTINANGYVSMDLTQEVSSATAEVQFGAPVINTREVQTRLLVRDGHTVVIGGLISTQKDRSASGVPILKDLPLIGWLFRSSQSRTVSSELFLLLTPHVLQSDEDVDDVVRQLRENAKDLQQALPDTIPLIRPDSTWIHRDSTP
jgi:general secretion pathway protein D